MKNPKKEQLEKWQTDDKYWKCAGTIYYNKEDERVFPPKRIGWMGWTVNFANSKSVALFIVILVFILFMMAFLPKNWVI